MPKFKTELVKLNVAGGNLGTGAEDMEVMVPLFQNEVLKKWVIGGLNKKMGCRWANQKSKQMNWYCYSPQHISDRTFNDEYFHEMLESADEHFAFMERLDLVNWVDAEWEVFLMVCEFLNDSVADYFYGNECIQFFHDHVTLANGHKYLAQGVQLVFEMVNWTIGIGFSRSRGGKAPQVALEAEETIKRSNFEMRLIGDVVSDVWLFFC